METFIASVRAIPCLWNPLHPDYREMQVRNQSWLRVVKQCELSSVTNVKTARATWRKLRDNHREALKRAKLGQNKLLPAHITTWKYAKAMQFLEPHMKYRITENIEAEDDKNLKSEQGKYQDHSSHTGLEQDVSISNNSDSLRDSPPHKRRCTDYASESTNTLHQEGDALESFFKCMLKSTREMPPWLQTQVKKKIFAVIINAEEQMSSHGNFVNSQDSFTPVNNVKIEHFTEDSNDIEYS